MEQDAARVELRRRVAAMGGARASRAALAAQVDAIRSIAHRAGLHPAATVAHLLDDALARGERGPLVDGWIAVLGDAIGSERSDPAAAQAYAAACVVRQA